MATARDKLLDSAVGLIRSQGVAGTTVADLLERSGVARRSLYLSFPGGREELLAEASRLAGSGLTEGLTALLAGVESPVDAVGLFVDVMRDGLVASDYRSGCPVVASALAGPSLPASVEHAGSTFQGWVVAIAAIITAEGIDPTRARSLAHLLVAAVEGATVVSIGTRSTEPLDAVTEEMQTYLAGILRENRSGPSRS